MSDQVITDIHAHVLPGVDDGPADIQQSQELIEQFRASGTHQVFCTSHFLSPHFDATQVAMDEAYRAISPEAASTSVTIAAGAEVRLTSAFVDVIREDNVPTLGNTKYVLVEFRSDVISERSLELVHELIVRDFQPIMAHPERNLAIQKKPQLVDDLLRAGLLFQLTAWCFDKSSREAHVGEKLAWKILEDGHATVIASDAHNTTTRAPGLLRAYENIGARLGQSVVDALIENANAIWNDEPCVPVEVTKRKRFALGGLFK